MPLESFKKTKLAPFAAPQRLEENDPPLKQPNDYCWSYKLNGHRAMLVWDKDSVTLRSRKGHVLNHLIRPPLDPTVLEALRKSSITHLEGELVALSRNQYAFHSSEDSFLALSSAAAGKQGTDIQVVLFVFDVATVDSTAPFQQRLQLFREIIQDDTRHFIRYLKHYTPFVHQIKDIPPLFNTVPCEVPWPEGIVVRPLDATYQLPQMYKLRRASASSKAKLISMDPITKKARVRVNKQIFDDYAVPRRIRILLMTIPLPCEVTIDRSQKRIANIGTDWL